MSGALSETTIALAANAVVSVFLGCEPSPPEKKALRSLRIADKALLEVAVCTAVGRLQKSIESDSQASESKSS